MTVRFIKSWNGYYEGQVVSNPTGGNSEATLISLGYAVADLDGPDNSPVLVKATTDPLTGGIGLVAGQYKVPAAISNGQAATGFAINDDIASPLEIANCELWLDAKNGPVTAAWVDATDGQAVATWLDNSGNGRHATPAAGTPLFKSTEGYGGKAGVKIGATCRMVTPAFVTSGYGSAITVFCVTKEDTTLHSALKVKLSISTANFWNGNTGTTGLRDVTINGITGFSGFGGSSGELAGIDYISVGAAAIRGTFDGVSQVVNGSQLTDTQVIGGTIPFTNGALTIGGIAGSATYDWPGTVSEVLVFSRALSTSELRRVCTYLSQKWAVKKTVVLLGNSLVSGTGSTGGATQTASASGTNLPSRLIAAIGSTHRIRTDAYPGRTSAQIYSESPSFTGVTSDLNSSISVVWEGTNTLATTASVVKAYDDLRRVCLLRKRPGRRVIVCTVLLRGDSGNDAKNAALTAKLNSMILANYAEFADAVVNLAADSRLQDFNSATYFDADKTHLKDAGYQVVSDLLAPAILALG